MYGKPKTKSDLKQKIEDMFVKHGRGAEVPWADIVRMFKRATHDRIGQAIVELVQEGRLIEIDPKPFTSPHYRLA